MLPRNDEVTRDCFAGSPTLAEGTPHPIPQQQTKWLDFSKIDFYELFCLYLTYSLKKNIIVKMNQDEVKYNLLQIENTELEFSVIFTGKKSNKVNGLYKPDTHEIILHNRNFSKPNELFYTAIHEYTHHKLCEENGGLSSSRVHSPRFWARFHGLLEKAEELELYTIDITDSPELLEITDEIKNSLLPEDGKLVRRLGELLIKARPLCAKAGVRYEDYIDRILCLPRAASTALERCEAYNINPNLGYENMKQVSKIGSSEKRKQAETLFLSQKSPSLVQDFLRTKKSTPVLDKRTVLEREKLRIKKTIISLERRLHLLETELQVLNQTPQAQTHPGAEYER